MLTVGEVTILHQS